MKNKNIIFKKIVSYPFKSKISTLVLFSTLKDCNFPMYIGYKVNQYFDTTQPINEDIESIEEYPEDIIIHFPKLRGDNFDFDNFNFFVKGWHEEVPSMAHVKRQRDREIKQKLLQDEIRLLQGYVVKQFEPQKNMTLTEYQGGFSDDFWENSGVKEYILSHYPDLVPYGYLSSSSRTFVSDREIEGQMKILNKSEMLLKFLVDYSSLRLGESLCEQPSKMVEHVKYNIEKFLHR